MRVAHGINLAQLRAFVAVVDAGGFGLAASELGITQSAVSHAVGALERTVGARVLDRKPDAATPTTLGVQLLGHARSALAATEAIGDLAAAQHGTPRGTVRLAAPPTVCQGMLPAAIADWRTRLPRVTVRVFEGEHDEVTEWLSASSVEAAVLVDPPRATSGALLATDRFQVLLPREHPLSRLDVLDLADLADVPLLFSGGSCEQPVRDLYRHAGLRLTPTHQVRELSTLFAMVSSGLGAAIVPSVVRSAIGPDLALVALRRTHERQLILTGPPDRPWHPAVTALVDAVQPQQY
jgi:DNA-binding transcriptional LysR family regulator